jgi:hypothetical protein
MTKNKKSAFSVFAVITLLAAAFALVAPAVQKANRQIPFCQKFKSLNDLASRLDVSPEMLEDYLSAIDSDYEKYTQFLNDIQMTPRQLTEEMQKNTGYSFSDCIQTIALINNKTAPDEEIYDKISTGGTTISETADVSVYVNKISLKNLTDNNINMCKTTAGDENTVKLFHLYALLSYVNGDIPAFISGANEVFGCEVVQVTNVNVYANYDVKKPDNYNKMLDDMFNVKDGSGELYKAIPMPVLTLKYADKTRNICFGVIDPAGLIFTAKDVESLAKMQDIEFFDVHVRHLQVPDDPMTSKSGIAV